LLQSNIHARVIDTKLIGGGRKLPVRVGVSQRVNRGATPPSSGSAARSAGAARGLPLSEIRNPLISQTPDRGGLPEDLRRYDIFPSPRGRAPCRARAARECGSTRPRIRASLRTDRAASSR